MLVGQHCCTIKVVISMGMPLYAAFLLGGAAVLLVWGGYLDCRHLL